LILFEKKTFLFNAPTMARKSGIRVANEHIPTVKQALYRRFYNQMNLADTVGLCRDTVHKFLNGKPIDRWNFIEICETLGLDWRTVANLNVELNVEASEAENNAPAPLPRSTEHDEQIESIAKRNAEILVTLFKNIRSQLPSDVSDEVVAKLAKAALSEAKEYGGYQLDKTKESQ
jgi:DNA-binding XRE family transcriptional regulator